MKTKLQAWIAVGAAAIVAGAIGAAKAEHVPSVTEIGKKHGTQLVLPMMNPARGKKIFVDKGCVACHAINGVGGHDAPALDAHIMHRLMNPFDFAAKMWNHASAMIAAQEGALGEQVYFTGEELADMIAFVHSDAIQHGFSEKDLTAKARKMMAHEHGGEAAPSAHAHDIGHDAPGSAPHKD